MATKRPEKHFAKKDSEATGASGPSSLQGGGMTKAMSSMRHAYIQRKATQSQANMVDNKAKLNEATELYLIKSEPGKRLSDNIRNMIDVTLGTSDDVDLMGIIFAFECLEQYALNLVWHPWKKQIKKIKVHAAYIKMHVEPHLKGTKEIFRRLGYERSRLTNDELVIDRMPERDAIFQVAFDCYIATKEMEIYQIIFTKVRNDGFSVKDVHTCRTKCNGNDKDAVTWIWDNCEQTKKKKLVQSPPSLDSSTLQPGPEEEPVIFSLAHQPPPDTHPRALDKDKATRLRMYEEEARKAPRVPPRGSSSTTGLLKDLPLPYIDGERTAAHQEGTLEEHVSESLRQVEKSNTLESLEIKRPPPGEEWREVRKTVENLGEKYYDPGGRGDILRGDEMVPRDDDDLPPRVEEVINRRIVRPVAPVKAPGMSQPSYNSKYGTDPKVSITSGYNSKQDREIDKYGVDPKISITSGYNSKQERETDLTSKTSGYTSHLDKGSIPRVNLMQSDLYSSSTNVPPLVSQPAGRMSTNQEQADSLGSFSRNVSVDGPDSPKLPPDGHSRGAEVLRPAHEFTTFRGSEATSRPQIAKQRNPYGAAGGQTDDPDYVQLKQVNPRGKPSFEKNFQATTQRLYQASSNTSLSRQDSSDSRAMRSRGVTSEDGTETDRCNSLDGWQCTTCTFINGLAITTCEMCGKERQGTARNADNPGGHQCKHCSLVNVYGAKNCQACGGNLKTSPTFV